jgi:GDPmannose 4,6-dehydratase
MSIALICGISGQDGAYLAKALLEQGYIVAGTSRDAHANSFQNLVALNIKHRVRLYSMTLTELHNILHVLSSVQPDEIYNLAGQTSVALSFEQPHEAVSSVAVGTLNLLEASRLLGRPVRIYNAGSSESFGETPSEGATEETPFSPRSPYAVAKATSHWLVANFREAYGLFACNGILFNHESPLRGSRFVTRKIVDAACRIAGGSKETLRLGDLSIQRDWGWAPEYVEVMRAMLQRPKPEDFVVSTGQVNSLEDFVSHAFAKAGLHWRDHVISDPAVKRPLEIAYSRGRPDRARAELGWVAKYKMVNVIEMMMEGEGSRAETP